MSRPVKVGPCLPDETSKKIVSSPISLGRRVPKGDEQKRGGVMGILAQGEALGSRRGNRGGQADAWEMCLLLK